MGEKCRRDGLANGVGLTPKRRASLCDVVLQEPRFGEQHPDGQLVLSCERCEAERLRKKLCRVGGVAPFERGLGTPDDGLYGDTDHEGSIPSRTRCLRAVDARRN